MSYSNKQNIPYKIIKNDQKSINQIATLLNQLYAIYKNQEKVEMEYERKFIVDNVDVSNSLENYMINQYYLNIGNTEKRIRKINDKFYFTEKIGSGDTREEFECEIMGVACIVDRTQGKLDNEFKIHSLLKSSPVTYGPENCPLCKQGIELVKPGSRTGK